MNSTDNNKSVLCDFRPSFASTHDLDRTNPVRQQFLQGWGNGQWLRRLLCFWLFVCFGGFYLHANLLETSLGNAQKPDYQSAVQRLLTAFEQERGEPLRPGKTGRIALKLDTRRGLGLSTPVGLVTALMNELEQRGFSRSNIVLVDQREYLLRHAGFLPPLSVGGIQFAGANVRFWYSWDYVNPAWFYESPLQGDPPPERMLGKLLAERGYDKVIRSSYLPYLLIDEVDYWINMPVIGHLPAVGFSGALVNATLFNVTNEDRFLGNQLNAPVAIAEISAIPEIREKWLFNIVSMERYQFEGGPMFNAYYTQMAPLLWLSADPVAVDAAALEKVNAARVERGFEAFAIPHPVLEYAEKLGVGSSKPVIRRVE